MDKITELLNTAYEFLFKISQLLISDTNLSFSDILAFFGALAWLPYVEGVKNLVSHDMRPY